MILLIDNFDSFTYNLYQYLGELGQEVIVKRNNQISVDEIRSLNPSAIILSPGPGRPEEAGICIDVIKELYTSFPILGICLGHQAIGVAFNSIIHKAENIMHGKMSNIVHSGTSLFSSLPALLQVMRYHSLVIQKETLSSQFNILAIAEDDKEIMAIKHQEYPLYGLQFHPESIGTMRGKEILQAFVNQIKGEEPNETLSSTPC